MQVTPNGSARGRRHGAETRRRGRAPQSQPRSPSRRKQSRLSRPTVCSGEHSNAAMVRSSSAPAPRQARPRAQRSRSQSRGASPAGKSRAFRRRGEGQGASGRGGLQAGPCPPRTETCGLCARAPGGRTAAARRSPTRGDRPRPAGAC
eukprot:Amastigsp_a343121_5.p4 type:complete len:148 gc:universal Amastigsp_a343121_5:1191-748(-)